MSVRFEYKESRFPMERDSLAVVMFIRIIDYNTILSSSQYSYKNPQF